MIILDTNVISALMHHPRDPTVTAWLDDQPHGSVWITSIGVYEVRMGIEILPGGRRRAALETAFVQVVAEDIEGRVLPFDRLAAEEAGILAARRRAVGRPIEFRDTQIAGIAVSRRAAIATRNTRHFADLPVEIVDPWAA